MNYYINVQGGTGLNFGLASFISYLKNNGTKDKFYVSSSYWDIFESCPAVDGVYKPNELKDMIFDAKDDPDSKIITSRIYDLDGFIKKQLNYSEAWAQLLGISWDKEEGGTKVKSELEPLKAFPYLKDKVEEVKKEINGRKYIIVQFTGGQSPLTQVPDGDWSKVNYDYNNEPLKRHYPTDKAQKFIDLYQEKHPDTVILTYQLPNEPKVTGKNVISKTMPYLAYYELAKDAEYIVAIDSSLQHMCAGVCKEYVIWAHSKPEHFGYNYNTNILQECRTNDLLYFTALGPSGAKVKYIEPEELLNRIE